MLMSFAQKEQARIIFDLLSARPHQYCGAMKVKVVVTPKAAVLDPQGAAVRDAMQHLGMPEVREVRVGKYLEIELDGKNDDIEKRLCMIFAGICSPIP